VTSRKVMREVVRRLVRVALLFVLVVAILLGAGWVVSGDVRYLVRAGVEEARILAARRPITEVAADPRTSQGTRGKLLMVLAARSFAADSLGLVAKETYTTYSTFRRDTLVLVLSASPAERLSAYTWRYPIVGRVPYKGFFSFELAAREAAKLERLGMDTYLRVANAFSTLGWFNDPLLSTIVDEDSVDLAATVIHEILHNTLFVPGHVEFNESFANFVGYRGAESFFRARGDTRNAERAAARWRDEVRLARFYEWLSAELNRIYAMGASGPELQQLRLQVFGTARSRLAGSLAAEFETLDGRRMSERPLNNAVVLAARVYRTRLEVFDSMLVGNTGLREVIAGVVRRTEAAPDPWGALGTDPTPRRLRPRAAGGEGLPPPPAGSPMTPPAPVPVAPPQEGEATSP
jgi:predicted aminopeptidase